MVKLPVFCSSTLTTRFFLPAMGGSVASGRKSTLLKYCRPSRRCLLILTRTMSSVSPEFEAERRGDPGILVNHIFGDVAAGKLPEETPVDVLVGVEFGLGATIEEELPVDVLEIAVVGEGANPGTVTAGRVARDQGLDHAHFAER